MNSTGDGWNSRKTPAHRHTSTHTHTHVNYRIWYTNEHGWKVLRTRRGLGREPKGGRSRTEPKWNEGKRKEVEQERGEVEPGMAGVGRMRGNATPVVGAAARYWVVVDDERTNTDDLLAECKLAACL